MTPHLSSLEGGLVSERTETATDSKQHSYGADIEIVKGDRGKSSESSKSLTKEDTPEARFTRLHEALMSDPEGTGFVEVLEPDVAFEDIGIGAIVQWEAEVERPEFSRLIAQDGEAREAVDMMQKLAPMMEMVGQPIDDVPEGDVMDGFGGILKGLNLNSICVGASDETDWTIAGPMKSDAKRDEIDGDAIVLGKVKKRIPEGDHYHMMKLPGLGLARDKRRKLSNKPQAGQENEYLAGPLIIVDLIAIFR